MKTPATSIIKRGAVSLALCDTHGNEVRTQMSQAKQYVDSVPAPAGKNCEMCSAADAEKETETTKKK